MDKTSWPHVIGIVALIILCILRFTEKITEHNFILMFLPILGALAGVTVYTIRGRSSK